MCRALVFLFLVAVGCVAVGQTVGLNGPTGMGRCEQAMFTVAFTAHASQTASAICFTVTLPNAGFVYVADSGQITLHDGEVVAAEPTPSGLNLVWDLDLLLGYPYALPPGETVTLEFAVGTGCGTISGTLSARVDYEQQGIPGYLTDSQPVEILPGAVQISKEPSVQDARVGDTVAWTITVENTGLGPIHNVVVTDTLGAGLAYVSATPDPDAVGGQVITWSLGSIPAGGQEQVQLSAEVVACKGLDNAADARFGCDDGSVCYDTAVDGGTATASVRLILQQPLLAWPPPTVEIPYCAQEGVEVVLPFTNVGEGPAYNVRWCVDCDPLVITNVGAGAYYEEGCFILEDPIPPNETFNLTFTVSVPDGWDWCAGVPSGLVICKIVYENVCGEKFYPPVQLGGFSTTYGPEGPPTLNVSLTGAEEVYICTEQDYTLSVSFSGLDACGNGGTSDISVVVDVPAGFTVLDAGGGDWTPGSDGTGGTISWTIPPTSPLSTTIRLRAPDSQQCHQVATLSATATAYDCCGCAISATSSVPIAIECYQLASVIREASPSVQEKCAEITYTNTYTFADDGPEVYFTDLEFIAYAENAQKYVAGSLTITIDGNPASPITVIDNTPGRSLVIQGIDDSGLVWGHTLVISYQLRLTPDSEPPSCPSSSTFYTWTTLNLDGKCAIGDECTEPCQVTEILAVTSATPTMSVSLTGLPDDFVDPCGTYDITLTLTKTSTFDPHDVVLTLENLNYYIVDLNSIQVSGVQPASPIPKDYGTYYEWEYGEAFVGQPNGAQSVLQFQVRKRCGPEVELRSEALYTDRCGGTCSVSDTEAPAYLRSPNLFVYKTPEVVYATQNEITWTIYVVNSGNGYAYEVWVDDVLGSGLKYESSSVTPSTGVTTTPHYDHLGNSINGVSWHIDAMTPGEQRVITLTARMVACSDLWDEVTTSLGCGGEDCLPPVSDDSTVLIPPTQLVATSSTTSPIATCTEQKALIRIRNAGDPAVYELVVREALPPGIEYVAGTTRWRKGSGSWQSGSDPTFSGDIWSGYTLEWTETEVPGLAELRSRQTLEIEFGIRALCNFTGGNLGGQVGYLNVCGEPGSLPVGTFRLDARQPSLSVNKVQTSPMGPVDCDSLITWRIDVTNTSDIPIPYVWVEDELGSAFEYVSSTGGIDGGYGSGSTATWVIENLAPGATAQLTITARHVFCGDLTNTVSAWWGCGSDSDGSSDTMDADCLTDIPATKMITASRNPTVSLSMNLDPALIPACEKSTLTLTLHNPSTASAAAVDVRISLPSGLSYVLGTTRIDCGGGFVPAGDPVESGGYLYWYDPVDQGSNLCDAIPQGGSVSLQFDVQANCYITAGSLGITVYYYDCCYSTQFQRSSSPTVQPALPVLTVTKTPDSVALDCHDPNSTVTWTITVTNTGAAQADWVRVEDTLGSSFVYVDSNPGATQIDGYTYAWEFGPLAPGESTNLSITAHLTRPSETCSAGPRTNTVRATWGCGTPDGDPTTPEGCASGIWVQDTALVTISDLYLAPSDIQPVLTCVADGNYQGRIQVRVRNQGDAQVTEDFRLTLTEAQTGWSVTGYFYQDFGGTLPINSGSSRTIWVENWPVSCDTCTYQFVIQLDSADEICECREGNNQNSRTWTITIPDITVRRETLALVCAGDGQVRISGTVTLGNEGCGSNLTADVPMRFVLHDGTGCSGTVLHQWTETFSNVNIPAGGEQTFDVSHTFSLDLCAEASGCTVSLFIEADYTDSICECDGTNNTFCTEFNIDIPDVVVTHENLALTCAGDGQVRISGTVTLGNEGCGDNLTANVPVRLTLYDQAGCNGTVLHQWTATFSSVNIPAGGEQSFDVTHTFPLDLCAEASGCTVSLLIEADYTGSICECDGTNNTLCTSFPVEIPDLAVVTVEPTVPDSCSPGQVAVTVANVGCVESPAGTVVRITGDATGETDLPSIPAGQEITVTVYLNEVLPCGTHQVTATVDPVGTVCECSSENNSQEAEFTVVDPDLTVSELTVECQGDGSFAVSAAVQNVGTEAAPPTTVRIYVEVALFNTVDIPPLAIGGSYTVNYVTPRIKCGEAHLFRLVVDENNVICECDEGNNEAQATASCGCPALVTQKEIAQITRGGIPIDPSLPIQAGDVITYRLAVQNVGEGKAFNVDISDTLPSEFLYISGTTQASWPSGTYSSNPSGAPGPSLFWDTSAELWPSETLVLEFQAVVTNAVVQGEIYTNWMYTTGEEGDGSSIPPDMSATVPADDDPYDCSSVSHEAAAIPALSVDKEIADVIRNGVSIWPTNTVEPGDLIHWRFTIRNIGMGTAYDVNFTDELPAGLVYVEGTYEVDDPPQAGSLGISVGSTGHLVADISATINGGGTLTADFFTYVTSAVQQGVALDNYAGTTGKDGYNTPIPAENPQADDTSDDDPDDLDPDDTGFATIGVAEPALALEKEIIDVLRGGVSIWPTPIVLWGDVIVYQVTVKNVGLGTAYDVDLTDELPLGLAYDTSYGDGTYTVDNPAASGSLGIPAGATGKIVADISATVAGGGTLVAVYRAQVTPDAVPGVYVTNLARVTGRDGAKTPIPDFNLYVNDTYPDQDSTTIRVGAPALVTNKAYYCEPCDPCAPESGDCDPCLEEPIEVSVGSTVGFQLVVANVGYSPAYDIMVEDFLPAGLVYVEKSAVVRWSGGTVQVEPTGSPGPVLTWVTGQTLGPGERLVITFDALVTVDASVGTEVHNLMFASGVDTFSTPIPADSSSFVPQDDDPDDRSALKLIVRAGPIGTAPPITGTASAARAAGGWAALGLVALGGLLALRFRKIIVARVLWLGVLVFLILAGWGADSHGATHTIVLTSDPLRGGTVFGAGQYETGERVTLTALPSRGFVFVAWFEDEENVSSSPVLEFIADRDRTLVARFQPSLEFVGIIGLGQGRLALLPTVALDTGRVEIRPRFLFRTTPWDLRFVAAFAGENWTDAQVHLTGSWEKLRFGGGMMFNPAGPAYRSAYFMISGPWDDLRLGFRVTHYPASGSPPAPYFLHTLTLSTRDLSVTLRGEERAGLMFKDASVSVFGMPICCGITAQGTFSFTKAGFSHAQVALTQLPFFCCGLTIDTAVTFTADRKAIELSPRWSPLCDVCLTVYGDVLWDRDAFHWNGFALYGYKIRCCFGSSCCPGGAGGYVEILTAFDPSQVSGDFQGDEFEYLKVHACRPACCGGTYAFDVIAFFSPTGLFGLSRIKTALSAPLFPSFVLTATLEAQAGGAALSVGWEVRF